MVLFLQRNHCFSSLDSATVNNLQAKVDALEKSNTKLTEEVSVLEILELQNLVMCVSGR